MPELPEVETIVNELDRKLKNKTITHVSVLLGKIVSLGPGTVSNIRLTSPQTIDIFTKKLKGVKVKSVKRRAKLLIFDFYGPLSMLVHLKMTGQFIYFKKSELNKTVRIVNKLSAPLHHMPTKYTHVIFTFTDGSKLFYNDVRQFGYLKLVTDKELPRVKELNEFGPEPLNKNFTPFAFLSAVKKVIRRKPKIAIKPLLMDSKFIAGIGNIYSDEILFRAKIAPTRQVKSLTPQEITAIYHAIQFILKKAIAAAGSSVGDFIRTDGSWGRMGKYHFVYGRAKERCKICGSVIKSVKFNGRTGSFCPKCQK